MTNFVRSKMKISSANQCASDVTIIMVTIRSVNYL